MFSAFRSISSTIMLKEITANELLGLFENYNEVLCKISQNNQTTI